ncbi:MAG: DUF5610 domain-containing protein [Candidatus Hydrogenedentes bacterium]|nr:DUF5610 domain-containing protein [Candidatus Hydrogenedentota bacterium]
METSILALGQSGATTSVFKTTSVFARETQSTQAGDRVDLGQQALSSAQAMNIVMERALDKLRGVVDEARTQLGLPEDAVLDTSPEATANRIADFAIGAFSVWQKNHSKLGEEDAREQFASFIGGAIQQGIEEARGILSALNALSGEVDTNINTTWDIIQQRLSDFVSGK